MLQLVFNCVAAEGVNAGLLSVTRVCRYVTYTLGVQMLSAEFSSGS